MEAIKNDRSPNFFFLQYELATWSVKNLLLVPHFAFPPSAIIKRKPLSPTARRAGWVGCNFALNRIPVEARIAIVTETQIVPEKEVREKFKKVKPLEEISVKQRGWTLDVLNIVRRLDKPEFTNDEVYAFTRELEKLHPDNRHVKDKIRQQLQVLRDAKLLVHTGSGVWRLP
jgi:type II restriction enzyme